MLGYGLLASGYPPDMPEHLPGAPRLVTAPVAGPAWAPDGRRVVGTSGETKALVEIVDMQTQKNKVIYVDEGTGWPDLNDPAWSPIRRFIAFASSYGDESSWIDLVDIRLHPVIRTQHLRQFDGSGSNPSWSPDGKQIAFEDGGSVYVKQVTARLKQPFRHRLARNSTDPAWSPDGRKIVCVRRIAAGNTELFVMNADGSKQRRLTFRPGNELHPDWQPVPR